MSDGNDGSCLARRGTYIHTYICVGSSCNVNYLGERKNLKYIKYKTNNKHPFLLTLNKRVHADPTTRASRPTSSRQSNHIYESPYIFSSGHIKHLQN